MTTNYKIGSKRHNRERTEAMGRGGRGLSRGEDKGVDKVRKGCREPHVCPRDRQTAEKTKEKEKWRRERGKEGKRDGR